MQKKQNLPLSSSKPKLTPMSNEIGAVLLLVFEESRYEVSNRAAITPREIAVRIFSALVHSEAAASESPKLLLCCE